MAVAAAGAGAVVLAHWQPAESGCQGHARRSPAVGGREQTGERK